MPERHDAEERTANKPMSCRTPSHEECAAYISPLSAKTWISTPEDCYCTCCKRLKREIVRKSAQKKWTGSIRSIFQYTELPDGEKRHFGCVCSRSSAMKDLSALGGRSISAPTVPTSDQDYNRQTARSILLNSRLVTSSLIGQFTQHRSQFDGCRSAV